MISIFYEIALYLLALAFLTKKKYRKKWRGRLGREIPEVEKDGRPLIWIHAVSLGETKAIAPLAKKLKELGSRPLIVLSTVTETGWSEGERSLPFVDYHFYFPWDFRGVIERVVKKLAPDMVIVTETDFWLNFLKSVKKQGATLYLVNGKVSLQSFKRLKRFSFVARALFSLFDKMCVQGEVYAKRFEALGVPPAKLATTGNIKLYSEKKGEEEGKEAWAKRLGIEEGDLVVTFGSTHDPEEKILLHAFKTLSVITV